MAFWGGSIVYCFELYGPSLPLTCPEEASSKSEVSVTLTGRPVWLCVFHTTHRVQSFMSPSAHGRRHFLLRDAADMGTSLAGLEDALP